MSVIKPKRILRDVILADYFAEDLPSIRENEYKPSYVSARVPVYTLAGAYYCVTKKGEKLPEGWSWFEIQNAYPTTLPAYAGRGIQIWRAEATRESAETSQSVSSMDWLRGIL